MRFSQAHLEGLTEPQLEAVLHEEGPLLVVAGPGSGKTRVITCRVTQLVARGIHPSAILAITFTNKASQEMQRRVRQMCPFEGAWVRTFHSMCAAILRRWPKSAGLEPGFSIFDDQDQRRVVKGVLTKLDLLAADFRPRAVRAAISSWKVSGVKPQEARKEASGYMQGQVAKIYQGYEDALRESNAVDFDDLLVRTLEALREDAELRHRLQYRFEHVLIDEYQDTSPVQFHLASILADRSGNLCATGDPDQSIYGFRKADIRNILEFEKNYPGAKVVRLEQNFRSVGNVLKAADALISNNVDRHPKKLFTDKTDGEKVVVIGAGTESDEGHAIARAVLDAYGRGVPYKDIAILYRTNAQSRAIEAGLRSQGIPYMIVKGVEFYQRAEVKDLLAYLKLLANPRDRQSLARVLATPPKGVGAKSVTKIEALADEAGLTARQALTAAADSAGLSKRATLALRALEELLSDLQPLTDGGVALLLERAMLRIRYEDFLKKKYRDEFDDRWDNVQELVGAAREFDEMFGGDANLIGFLLHVGLVSDVDGYDEDIPRAPMMTLHTSKGLEFDEVVIAGLEDGLLPHVRSREDESAKEEERRLLFVGITRARKRVTLTYALDRRAQIGSLGIPSPFLDELPDEILDRKGFAGVENRGLYGGSYGGGYGAGSTAQKWNRRRYEPGVDAQPDYDSGYGDTGYGASSSGDSDADPSAGLRVGLLVEHSVFGVGRVRRLMGRGPRAKAVVLFQHRGEKTLALSHAKLTPLGH